MEAAKAAGLATLPEFLERLILADPGDYDFCIKFALESDGGREYIWASHLEIDREGRLTGRLANDPEREEFRFDQMVAIPLANVIDWQYFNNGIAYGHYTTQLLLERMPFDEAMEVRTALGWQLRKEPTNI